MFSSAFARCITPPCVLCASDDNDLDLACLDVSGTTVTRRVIYNQGLNCPAAWKQNTAISDCTAAFGELHAYSLRPTDANALCACGAGQHRCYT